MMPLASVKSEHGFGAAPAMSAVADPFACLTMLVEHVTADVVRTKRDALVNHVIDDVISVFHVKSLSESWGIM